MPGGWLFADSRWVVGVLEGLEVPGWVVLVARRHAIGVVGLAEDELASLGPVLARVSAAIQKVTEAEKVYFASFGERFPHFHVLLMSRPGSLPPQHRGAQLQPNAAIYRDVSGASKAANGIRQVLSGA